MKLLKILIAFILLASCALTPDFEFYYERNGKEFHAIGTSAAKFKQGDSLKIKIPKHPCRKCTAIVMTGNHDIRKSCKGKDGTFLVIDLGTITPRTLKTVALSVVRKGWDTQSGKLYLGMANAEYEAMPLDYECPYQSEIDNQFTCMRPKNFKFIFSIFPQENGSLQVSSSDCVGQKIKEVFNDFEAGDRIDFTIDPKGVDGYCPLRIDFIIDRATKRSSTLHVDFYKA